jgi:hypothetical protein
MNKKSQKIQEPIILDLFSDPATSNDQPVTVARIKKTRTPKPKAPAATTVVVESAAPSAATKRDKNSPEFKQAFLPGLSRRGRPRSKDPISAVERTAKHRRERLDAGSKRVEVILSPEVAKGLEALATHYKEPKSEVVSSLIQKAFAKLFKANAAPRS